MDNVAYSSVRVMVFLCAYKHANCKEKCFFNLSNNVDPLVCNVV